MNGDNCGDEIKNCASIDIVGVEWVNFNIDCENGAKSLKLKR